MPINRTGSITPKLDENEKLFMERIIDINGNTERLTPESLGYVKQIELTVVFSRTATDNVSMTEKTGYFKHSLKLTFDNPKTSKYVYFYHDPKIMSNVAIKDLDSGFCQLISLSKPRSVEDNRLYNVHYGKISRITKPTAIQLLQSKQALFFDSDDLTAQTVYKGKI